MLFGPNITYLNELEINGEHVDDGDNEDFTNNQPEPDEDETVEDIDDEGEDDDLTDFTEDEFSDTDDEDIQDDDAALEDFTEDEFSDTDDEGEDQTPDEETNTDDEEPVVDDEGEDDDLTDFTEDEFSDTDDEGEDQTPDNDDSEEGDNAENSEEGGEPENSDSADNKNNTLADMEKTLFSDMTPQQLAIKNNELLQNYIGLYETINTIFDSINKIPKTFDNTRPLSFIADQLIELKDMVNYVITTTYVTRTYVENMAYYKQALVVLEQLNSMLKALVKKPVKS